MRFPSPTLADMCYDDHFGLFFHGSEHAIAVISTDEYLLVDSEMRLLTSKRLRFGLQKSGLGLPIWSYPKRRRRCDILHVHEGRFFRMNDRYAVLLDGEGN